MSLGTFALATIIVYPAAVFGQAVEWVQERQVAIELRQHGHLPEAMEAAAKVLAKAEHGEPGSAPLALALHDYGIIAADLNRFDEAERALRRAVSVAEATPLPDTNVVPVLRLRLGEVYLEASRFRDAKAVFLGLQGSLEQTEPASPHLAMALDHLAWLQLLEKHFDASESLLQRALRILDGNPQAARNRMPELLNDYASLMLAQRRFTESAGYAEQAESFFNSSGRPIDLAAINTWTLLAAGYAFSGRAREAHPYILRAIDAAKSTYGSDSVRAARIMLVGAAVLRKCGQKSEAKPLQKAGAQIVAKANRESLDRFTVDVNALR